MVSEENIKRFLEGKGNPGPAIRWPCCGRAAAELRDLRENGAKPKRTVTIKMLDGISILHRPMDCLARLMSEIPYRD
jgi:hypothetical protein